MTTLIADVFVPQVLSAQIAAEMDTRSSALIRSGAVVNDPLMASIAAQNKGSKITMPQYPSYTSADVVGSDKTTETLSTVARPDAFEVDVPMLRRVVNFSAMDLARAQANADPLGDVAVQAAEQIVANQNTIVVSSLEGVRADNVANNSGDMVTDLIGTETTASDARRISRSTVISAVSKWGDFGNRAAAIVMHSAVYYGLLGRDKTSFRQEGEQGFVNTYMGIPIVLDDSLITGSVGTSPNVLTTYTTIVMAPGAVGFASLQGSPVLDRNELIGNGWGQETLIVRRTDLVNPRGIDFSGSAPNATNAQLDDAASWARKWKQKNVGISFIKSFA